MSVKKNFLYNSTITVSNYLFPLLTYPYVSRVLGLSNIGICNFIDSVIYYFYLLSFMGITTCGIREIARVKGDKNEMSKSFSGLLMLHFLSTLVAIATLLICMYSIPKFFPYRDLLYIGVVKLIFQLFLVEWFYAGLEDFSYITKRTILIKILYVISVFGFVHHATDYKIYFFLSVAMIGVNAFINLIHTKKFIMFLLNFNIKKYLVPFFTLGFYAIITSMYTTFNTTFLGFVCGTDEVGNYTTATKLYSIIIALFTAFTGVMIPRMTSLVAENKIDEFKNKCQKSMELLISFTLPATILFVIFSPDLVYLLAGKGFEGAYLPSRIVMPLLLIIGLAQILVMQILTPLKKDRAILVNSIFGAILGVSLNFCLVPYYGAVGAALSWVLSEVLVTISAQIFVFKYINILFPFKEFFKVLLFYMPAIFVLLLTYQYLSTSPFIRLGVAALFTLIYTFFIQIKCIKNEFILTMFKKFFSILYIK